MKDSHARMKRFMKRFMARLSGGGLLFAATLAIQACAAPAPDRDQPDDRTPRPAVETPQDPDDRPDGPGIL